MSLSCVLLNNLHADEYVSLSNTRFFSLILKAFDGFRPIIN